MEYLVEMKLANSGRPTNPQDGISFIEQQVLPTLEACKKLQEGKKVLAGGPKSSSIALAMILRVESTQELDELIGSLPLWPRMETTVVPLISFDARIAAVRNRLERLKAGTQSGPTGA